MKKEEKEERRKRGRGTAREEVKNFKLRNKDLQGLIFKINACSTLS